MQLRLREGIADSILVTTATATPSMIEEAVRFAATQCPGKNITLIVTDRQETVQGVSEKLHSDKKINRVFFTKEEVPSVFEPSGEVVVIVGTHAASLEHRWRKKVHATVLDVNLNSLLHNLSYYRTLLKPGNKIMSVIKANCYGAGAIPIAALLSAQDINYFAVAYPDEGIALREAGNKTPVMVMNADPVSFDRLIRHCLEPEIFSFRTLEAFIEAVKKAGVTAYPIHIKLDTGMYRLGFREGEIDTLLQHLRDTPFVKVASVFSHLVASEEAAHDAFTCVQFDRFEKMSEQLMQGIDYPLLRHMSNSAGVIRWPEKHFDMVRFGIGLYGMTDTMEEQRHVKCITTLRTRISQIKEVPAGDTVGYNRRGPTARNSRIATVPIGYADGYSLLMSRGAGKMLVNGKFAPTIGQVCMDMTMLDITGIPGVNEGDEVIVYGEEYPVHQMAADAGVSPYEILTRVGPRIERVYTWNPFQ